MEKPSHRTIVACSRSHRVFIANPGPESGAAESWSAFFPKESQIRRLVSIVSPKAAEFQKKKEDCARKRCLCLC